MVRVIPSDASGLDLDAAKNWSPDTQGVAGKSNFDDFFGKALATGDLNNDGRVDLAIGARGEHVNSVLSTGGVTVLYAAASGDGLTATGSQIWVQSSPGVPGLNETSDHFGEALVISGFAARLAMG